MSRYAFGEIFSNFNKLQKKQDSIKDKKGYTLGQWFSYAVVGYDIETYFLQFTTPEKEKADEMIFWIGIYPGDIQTMEELCEIINSLFPDDNHSFQYNRIPAIDTNECYRLKPMNITHQDSLFIRLSKMIFNKS